MANRVDPLRLGFFRTQDPDFKSKHGHDEHTDIPKVWRIQCSKCDAFCDQRQGNYVCGDDLAMPLLVRRWFICLGAEPICPKCRGVRSADQRAKPMAQIIELPPQSFAAPPPPPAQETTVNLKLQRAIIEALQEYFDEKNGRYINQWSDQKIAETTGASVAIVQEVRKQAFGEIVEDTELAEIRASIQALEASGRAFVEQHNKDLQDVRRRFDSYVHSKRKRLEGVA